MPGCDQLDTGTDPHLRDILDEVCFRDCYRLRELHRDGLLVRTAVDLGASFGPAAALIDELWPEASITCFEPDDGRFTLLMKNNAAFSGGRWQLASIAVADTMNRDLVGFDGDRWRRTPWDAWAMTASLGPVADIAKVECLAGSECDLLKIDVEGFEWGILHTLKNLGRLPKVVTGEWHFTNCLAALHDIFRDTHAFSFERPGHEPWGPFLAIAHTCR